MEKSIFDKLVVIYKYFRYLSTEPLAKELLRKIYKESEAMGTFIHPDEVGIEEFLEIDKKTMYSKQFWMYMENLEKIHDKMKILKECKMKDRKLYEDICACYSKPYSEDLLDFTMQIVNSGFFEKISENKFIDDKEDEKTSFDEKRGLLYLKGEKITINKQDKITNAYKILKYIFITNKDNLTDDFFYSEIAENEFNEIDYKNRNNNWQKYHTACKDIQSKIEKQTKDNISDFLIFNTGRTGKVSINKKYI
ncbi:hypothetical protein C0583_01915 [Candidatus Parcubacteria bacterium]|nr:MAG: hypothetical protein C0583_01915 [Candidatus Parcubacteria bacterium]